MVAFLGWESTLDGVPFKDVGGTKSASACPALTAEDETFLGRSGEEFPSTGSGRDALVSTRFLKNFLGGRLGVGGEVGLCLGFLPLLVTFEGMTLASSSCSSSSSLPLFPPRCSTSSSRPLPRFPAS